MPATAPSLLHDFQKLDLEDERRTGLDRGRPALIAVRQVGGAHEPTLAADLHHGQALAPAFDDAAQAERQRFAALDGAADHRAVDELPLVVDLHLVGRRRRGAVARFQRRDDQPRGRLDRTLLGGDLVEKRLRRLLLGDGRCRGARRRELLDLRPPGLEVGFRLRLEDAVGEAGLDDFEISLGQIEAGEVPGDHEAEGVEGLLLVGLELGPRRSRASGQDEGERDRRRPLDGRRAVRAHDPARRTLRVGEHAPGRRDRRARARVLHDRPPLARKGQGPARVAPLDGPLLRAPPRDLRRAARAARRPRRRAPDPRVLPPRPRAARRRGSSRGPGDDLMLKPEDILRAIAAARGDAICVPTMTTAPAWRTLAPDDLSVTCVGFMGGASSLGLGLALARPDRRVIVFDGDGSLLMQLGSLATIAGAQARNLTHLVFKNGVYHTSGAQGIPGGLTVDFVLMAKGAGYRNAYAIREPAEFKRRLPAMLTEEGPVLVELHTGLAEKTPMTDRGGLPFHRQAEALRTNLLRPRA